MYLSELNFWVIKKEKFDKSITKKLSTCINPLKVSGNNMYQFLYVKLLYRVHLAYLYIS